jgi:hypothetical protein
MLHHITINIPKAANKHLTADTNEIKERTEETINYRNSIGSSDSAAFWMF